ncbi:MAG: site-2 protease family protein [Chitinispirillaceae bacterium]|nr:site-2 protease family protein [Chitinispirillaceae bacterium]
MHLTPEYLILRIPAILIALTVHECAHGWVAFRLGDRTAYDAGRVTLNPFVHLDLFGTLMLLFGPFGWAKPVPVDPRYFQNPKKSMLQVSAAGPASNIALALLFGYTLRLIGVADPSLGMHPYLVKFLTLSILMNTGIAFFNLLPVPPLDGSKILLGMLPNRLIPGYIEKSRYLPIVFMVLLVLEWGLHIPIFSRLIYPIFSPFYNLIHFLIFWRIS